MRLWSLHPKYLDTKGLLALWREALLAKAVLEGKTRGYKKHPQLERFRRAKDPLSAINGFLRCVYEESLRRGYRFDERKFKKRSFGKSIPVNSGQLRYECGHLAGKLRDRASRAPCRMGKKRPVELNDVFKARRGPVETWEKAAFKK